MSRFCDSAMIGIELSAEYCALARQQLEAEAPRF